jgi:RNA polymerase sigma-70 factor, ECF subfamily
VGWECVSGTARAAQPTAGPWNPPSQITRFSDSPHRRRCDTRNVEVIASRGAAPPVSVEALYHRYAQDVLAVAIRGVGTRADAEDVAQTTFLNAHSAILRGAKPTDERAWLLAITRNVCRHRFRTLVRRPREEPLDETRHESPDRHDGEEPAVLEALGALSPTQREALVLQGLHGCSPREIGARLGLGRTAVDALLFRARGALRDQLDARARPVACAEVDDLVLLQVEGRLPDEERARLRVHLLDCHTCATRARSTRARRRLASVLAIPWGFLSRLAGSAGSSGLGVKAATAVALVVGSTVAGHAVATRDGSDHPGAVPSAAASRPAVSTAQRPTRRPVSDRQDRPTAAPATGRLSVTRGAGRGPEVVATAPTPAPARPTAKPTGSVPAPEAAPPRPTASHGTTTSEGDRPSVPLEAVEDVLDTAATQAAAVELPDLPGVEATVEAPGVTVEVTVPPVETPGVPEVLDTATGVLPGTGSR